ncbi:MAG: class I SAM-dependent methyltransferase [Fervidicoccaceae archaeon]
MRNRILKEIVKEIKPNESLFGSLDIIGDIALLRIPIWIEHTDQELLRELAEKILKKLPYIKSVWLSASPISGEERLRELVHLAGEKRTLTIYKEHGVSFIVDVSKAYISPRLSYEHLRIAKLVGEGEVITNFFSGIGGFSLIIAKHSKAKLVNSIDINEDAVEMQKKSVELNGLVNKVKVFLGDAREVSKLYLKRSSNRVLLPLPGIDSSFYIAALDTLVEEGGYIHSYEFVKNERGFQKAAEEKYREIESLVLSYGWRSSLINVREVRSVGPRKSQIVLDIKVSP